MELSKSYLIFTLGSSDISGSESVGHATCPILAKDNYLGCDNFGHRFTYRHSCNFYHQQQYNIVKGLRLGDICLCSLHYFRPGLSILSHFTSIENLNCRRIFTNYLKLSKKQLFTFPLHSSLHWTNLFVRAFDSV